MNIIKATGFASAVAGLTLACLATASPASAQLDPDPQGAHSPSTGTSVVLEDQGSAVDLTSLGLGAAGGATLAGGTIVLVLGLRRRTRPRQMHAA